MSSCNKISRNNEKMHDNGGVLASHMFSSWRPEGASRPRFWAEKETIERYSMLDDWRIVCVYMPHCWLITATSFRYLSLLGRRRPSTTATEVAGGAGAPRCRPFASSDETTGGAAASEPGGSGPLPVEKLADETWRQGSRAGAALSSGVVSRFGNTLDQKGGLERVLKLWVLLSVY
jgi:hypothetical protein